MAEMTHYNPEQILQWPKLLITPQSKFGND